MSTVNALRDWPAALGLQPGQNVLLSADLTRVAWTHRRLGSSRVPALLLDAFLEHIGPQGTLVIPAFNHDLRSGSTYDPRHTKPITGALSVAALDHPAFARTQHPMHSFAVAGRLRSRFLSLADQSSFSSASPFALFREEAFMVVGIDLDLDHAFSYFHHVEELEQVPYRKWRGYRIHYVQNKSVSTRAFKLYAKRWGYANRLAPLKPLLEEAGALHNTNVDGCRMLRVDARASHTVIERDIRSNRARSIVTFTARTWLRDAIRSLLPAKVHRGSLPTLTSNDARTA